jgi:predicted dehydrogenase
MSESIAQTNSSGKAPAFSQNVAPSVGVAGANDRIAVAIVGIGWSSGQNHLWGLCEKAHEYNIVVAAACDVFEIRRARAAEVAKLRQSDVYLDYRKILDRKDIDAVLVATHDPLHAQIALDSLEAGKHVYCERPLTRYLGEAFQVFDKVKSTGKVFQVGVQSCSAGAWLKCAELIATGKIGPVVWCNAAYCRNGGPGCDGCAMITEESTPTAIDWEKWLGPAKRRPFSAALFHQWRMYYDYSAGLLACQAPQWLHPLMLASGRPEFPVRVNCLSAQRLENNVFKLQPGVEQVPAHVQLLAEFPAGHAITLTCSWLNGATPSSSIYGHKATLSMGASGDRVEVMPEKEFAREVNAETFAGLPPQDIREHEKNWLDCIRSGKRPNANIDLAIRAQTVLSLAEMSDRLKVTCLFDEETRKVTDGTGKEIMPLSYGNTERL